MKKRVVIVLAKCGQVNGSYGIRVEEKSRGKWFADWAFKIQETVAKKEGYGEVEIPPFYLDSAYPGCPYCGNKVYFQCGCLKLSCWNGEEMRVRCGWCGQKVELGGSIESITAGEDR